MYVVESCCAIIRLCLISFTTDSTILLPCLFQSFLYALVDLLAVRDVSIGVFGISSRLNTRDLLERRIASRYDTYIVVVSYPSTYPQHPSSQPPCSILCVNGCDALAFHCCFFPHRFGTRQVVFTHLPPHPSPQSLPIVLLEMLTLEEGEVGINELSRIEWNTKCQELFSQSDIIQV